MTDESSSEAISGAEETAAPASTPNARSPGAMIRSARERARLSVEELAAQIKLARPTLEALERDDFNQLLEPVYVRGYYRKCAKVLGLSEKDLIDAYHGRAVPKAPMAPSKLRLASGTELGTNNHLPMYMAIGFAVVAVILGIVFWKMGNAPLVDAPAPVSTLPVEPAPAPIPADGVTDAAPLTPGSTVTDASAPLAMPNAIPAAPGTNPAAPAGVTPAPGAAPVPGTAPAVAPAPAAAAPAGPTPAQIAAAANAPDGEVSLLFGNASWARVEDATGKVLLADLQRSGDSRTLKGKLPFTVFLGNGPGVTVEFEGKPVDFSARVGENLTARFQVPPKP